MKTTQLSPREFEEKLKTVNRVWNGREGLSLNQAKQSISLFSIDFIYVRDDNWSIGCSRFTQASCEQLWPDEWTTVYKKL